MTDPLRAALDAVVTRMSWRGGEGIIHDAEAWRTLVGRIVMATNGDNDGQVPMGAALADAGYVVVRAELRDAATVLSFAAHPSSELPDRYIVHKADLDRLRAALATKETP